MKAKKYIIQAIAMSMMLIIGSGQAIYGSNVLEESEGTTINISQEDMIKQPPHKHMRGKHLIKESVDELQKSGVLTGEDVKNIDAYHQKLREQRKEEMKKKRDAIIDDMVTQKVITKEKGEKLKSTIDKNIELKIKQMEQNN